MPPSSTSVPPAATRNCYCVIFPCAPFSGRGWASTGRCLRAAVDGGPEAGGGEQRGAGLAAGEVAEPGAQKIQKRAHARQQMLGARIKRPHGGVVADLIVGQYLGEPARAQLAEHDEFGGTDEAQPILC